MKHEIQMSGALMLCRRCRQRVAHEQEACPAGPEATKRRMGFAAVRALPLSVRMGRRAVRPHA
jgi:hypothetical protein